MTTTSTSSLVIQQQQQQFSHHSHRKHHTRSHAGYLQRSHFGQNRHSVCLRSSSWKHQVCGNDNNGATIGRRTSFPSSSYDENRLRNHAYERFISEGQSTRGSHSINQNSRIFNGRTNMYVRKYSRGRPHMRLESASKTEKEIHKKAE